MQRFTIHYSFYRFVPQPSASAYAPAFNYLRVLLTCTYAAWGKFCNGRVTKAVTIFSSTQHLFCLFQNVQTGSGTPTPTSFSVGTGFFPGGRALWPRADYSSPSSAEVSNEWSYTAVPLICLHDADRATLLFPGSTVTPAIWKSFPYFFLGSHWQIFG